jgi:hypothetical protein
MKYYIVYIQEMGHWEREVTIEAIFTDIRAAIYHALRTEYLKNMEWFEAHEDYRPAKEHWDRYTKLFLMLPEQTFEGDAFWGQWNEALDAIGDEFYYSGNIVTMDGVCGSGPVTLKDKYQALEDKVKANLQ